MRPLAALLPLAILAACATPREACISDVTRELRTLDRLIAETRANVDRGYGLEERQEVRTVPGFCPGETEDGVEFTVRCERTETRTRNVPVAIDLDAERRQLDQLLDRRARQQEASDAAVRACVAAYPAE